MSDGVGGLIRQLRLEQGETQAEVARRAGINNKTLWSIEHGVWDGVQFRTFESLVHALGYEIELRKIEEDEERMQIRRDALRVSLECEAYAKATRRKGRDGTDEDK